MEEIKIEKGIEIRIKREHVKYPFSEMEVGDSFYVDIEENSDRKTTQCMLLSASKVYIRQHKLDVKFATRQWNNGIRIWRIK